MNITTQGKGIVSESVVGNTRTLLAKPKSEAWHFKHFIIDGAIKEVNPLIVSESDEFESVVAFFCVTIETYLKGLVGFEIDELALNSIRLNRGVEEDEDVSVISERTRDLMYADVLMWASTNPTSYTGTKISDMGYSITEAGKTISVNDKKRFEKQAMEVYKRYDDPKYSTNIRIVQLW